MKTLKYISDILVLLFLAFMTVLFSILLYIRYIWPDVDYEQILITLRDLSLHNITDNASFTDYALAFIFFFAVFPLCYYFFSIKGRILAALAFLFLTLHNSGFISYQISNRTTSTLYEDHYVYPDDIKITFPDKKRNLILIYLESFEQNFAKEKHYERNLIPNLSHLQKHGGKYSLNHMKVSGANYSIVSLVASHCGIPLRYMADRDIYALRYFLPQAVCFSDILHRNGYQSAIIKAADISFTSADVFAKSHGYEEALGVDEILKKYPESQHKSLKGTFGGVNDKTLFAYAKEKLAEFNPEKPFLLTLFSLDTHIPAPHRNPDCPVVFNDLRDVYMCTDKTVYNFVSWLKESPYWDNTTVVIIGDHLLPARIKTKGHPRRGIYNVFLNTPTNLTINPNKEFSTYDIAPSILESLGITLSEPALGLGRSLFSKKDTLVSELGRQTFSNLIQQNSELYHKFHTPKSTRQTKFIPYQFGNTLRGKDFLKYTDAHEEILGSYYLDRINLKLPQTTAKTLIADIKFNTISHRGGHIIFKANNRETFKQPLIRKSPYHAVFAIPVEDIADGNLQLVFHNTSGISASTLMGISPIELTITEK